MKHLCGYKRVNGLACRSQVRELGQRCAWHDAEATAFDEARCRFAQDEELHCKRMLLGRRLATREVQLRALTSEVEHLRKQICALEADEPRTAALSNGASVERAGEAPS